MTSKPNIILIVMDTVRADHLPGWGYPRKTTPCLDEFSKSAIVFKQAISASPWTLPSHVSMFSGLHPTEHGVLTSGQRAGEDIPLIADILRINGYNTAGFTNNPWASAVYSLDRGFNHFVEVYKEEKRINKSLLSEGKEKLKRLFSMVDGGAERTNEHVEKWLNAAGYNKTPFFVFINYMDAHVPYLAKRAFPANLSCNSISAIIKSRKFYKNPGEICIGSIEPSQKDFDSVIKIYDDAICYLDCKIGELLDFLKKNSLFDNTMIIVTSDHGENFGEHKSLHKGVLVLHEFCLYDTLLHVPLIVKLPFEKKRSVEVHKQVQLTNIPSMILETVGMEFSVPGQSGSTGKLGELENDEDGKDESYAFSEYVSEPAHLMGIERANPDLVRKFDLELKSVRNKQHKLIVSNKSEPELYNLDEDPGELRNVAGELTDILKRLKQKIESWQNRKTKLYSTKGMNPVDNEEIKKRLQALGYF